MRKILQLVALILALAAVVTWAATGANRGWTKTSEPVKTTDPVTGIDGITYQPKFLPGMDFLGAAFGGGAVLAAASFLFRKPKTKPTTEPTNP